MPDQFLLLPERRSAYRAMTALVPDDAAASLVCCRGVPGSGKTALLSVAASQADRRGESIVRTTDDEWIRELLAAERSRTRPAFLRQNADCDRLLVDGVAAFATAPNAAKLFAGLLDDRAGSSRQTLLADRSLPDAIAGMPSILRDRLRGGTQCELVALSPPSAVRVLRHFGRRHHITFEPGAEAQTLESVTPQPGAIAKRVAALASPARRNGGVVTERLVASLVRRQSEPRPTIRDCESAVAREFSLSVQALRSHKRDASVALPRQIAMHLARKRAGATLAAIGDHFGGRNHTTVLHGCRTVVRKMRDDPTLARRIASIEIAITQPR